ncbi:hypothetical protein EDB80DRAFT_831692 [Ilyonectria destructans]|nr:hypothetical protein EDB80DRAFT_831692 [Ilyonectria destructans]
MACSVELPTCTICGMMMMLEEGFFLDRLNGQADSNWMSNVTALSGPCWRHNEKGPSSMEIPDDIITRYVAVATYSSKLQLIPSGRIVTPQLEYDLDRPLNTDPIPRQEWFFSIHTACEEISNQVMQRSRKSQIRSTANLWMTLDRRCMKTHSQGGLMDMSMNFLPNIPENQLGESLKLGLSGYYVPDGCIYRLSNERDGWVRGLLLKT